MRETQAVVKFLIDNGADVNVRDRDGMTPLDYARRFAPNNGLLHEIVSRAGAR